MRTAIACLKERHLNADALTKLAGLLSALLETLEKAEGYESPIPQLQQALTAFEAEEYKLRQAHASAAEMLRKPNDFLSVPASIRPIPQLRPRQLVTLEESLSPDCRVFHHVSQSSQGPAPLRKTRPGPCSLTTRLFWLLATSSSPTFVPCESILDPESTAITAVFTCTYSSVVLI